VFEIVDWADMQGNLKSDGEAVLAEPEAPKPAPAAAAVKPARTKPALVEDTPAAPRPAQRRRPPAA
jgi:hypothetical protein